MSTQNVDFLNEIYQNADMGIRATEMVIAKSTDNSLKTELYSCISQYQQIADQAKAQLAYCGECAEDISAVSNAQVWMGVQMSTLTDKTPSHIAEMFIQGSNMGVIDGIKAINEHPNAGIEIKDLATKLVDIQKNNMDIMHKYL